MSGYRSLKRVLGESNLERKCRWLFGICVGGLIVLSFWWVDWIAEDLIDGAAQYKGQDLARLALIDVHWQRWVGAQNRELHAEMADALFSRKDYTTTFLKLDNTPEPILASTVVSVPGNDFERELLTRLKLKAEKETPRPSVPVAQPATPDAAQEPIPAPIFEAFPDPRHGQYYYYQVVHWSSTCIRCHEGMHGQFAEADAFAAGNVFDPRSTPFRVVRVSMPYADTQSAINRTRAILFTVGFLTVVLAMVALYYVVKYIVVKPLNHLRDVSDAVASGNLDQRADIRTNDEFEELAESFNKMLRHLIEAQTELQDANLQLDGKVDELARLNMQLHEMNRLKGEFLANMSHELRTPLNSIIGFSEVLQSIEALNEKQKRYAQNIQKSGRVLLDMINDILDLAKMEAGKMEVRLSEFRLDSVIQTQCEMVRNLAEEKNISLTAEIEGDLPLLYQDQAKVQQILTNLLSNAIKFTPEGGRITVGAKGDSRGRVEFWVADTGVGIPESEREIIFEKFRQGQSVLGQDNLTREYSGTGLGLSIVKELCKLLGGEVKVESELGKGSTFRVTIPWMRADQAAAPTKLSAKLDELAKPRRLDTLRTSEPEPVDAALR